MTRRTVIALLMLAFLIAVFAGVVALRPAGPVTGTLAFLALVGTIRFMSRFENIGLDSAKKPTHTPATPELPHGPDLPVPHPQEAARGDAGR